MKKNIDQNPSDYIMTLNMNGLQGRMLYIPAPASKTKEILCIYGHHSTIERWWGLACELNKYGAVTLPDLPGFGGMKALYRLGEKPTIDRMADYLAAFIKLRYKRRRFTIVGIGYGFVIATRVLQRYPDLTKKVDLLVSINGFSRYDDLSIQKPQLKRYRVFTRLFSFSAPALLFRSIYLQPSIIRKAYSSKLNGYKKYHLLEASILSAHPDMEVELWRNCDIRTHMATINAMLSVDNCQVPVAVPVWHVMLQNNNYLNEHSVEQHMRVIFNHFHQIKTKLDLNNPIVDRKSTSKLIPLRLRRELMKA